MLSYDSAEREREAFAILPAQKDESKLPSAHDDSRNTKLLLYIYNARNLGGKILREENRGSIVYSDKEKSRAVAAVYSREEGGLVFLLLSLARARARGQRAYSNVPSSRRST